MNKFNTSTDNISTFDIGTDSVSDIQYGGGLLSFLGLKYNSNSSSDLILDAFADRNIVCACYMINKIIEKNSELDLNCVDSNKRNILHNLVMYSGYNRDIKELLFNVLKYQNVFSHLNHQDKDGNTVAHIALKLDQDDVLSELISLGIDLTIRNNEGLYISLRNMPLREDNNDLSDSIFILSKKSDQDNLDNNLDEKLDSDIINVLAKYRDSSTISFNNKTDTDAIISLPNNPTSTITFDRDEILRNMTDNIDNIEKSSSELETSQIIDAIMNELNNTNQPETIVQKKITNTDNNTTELIKNIMADFEKTKNQSGGSKHHVSGRRKLVTYSELSFGGTSSNFETSSGGSDSEPSLHELSRMMMNKSGEIHDRVVKKIMTLLNVSEEDAKIYKAALYRKVKEEHPELSNFDRATEMEKLTTHDELNKIDFVKTKSEIESTRAEKASSPIVSENEPKKKTKTKSEKSEKSQEKTKSKKGKKATKAKRTTSKKSKTKSKSKRMSSDSLSNSYTSEKGIFTNTSDFSTFNY